MLKFRADLSMTQCLPYCRRVMFCVGFATVVHAADPPPVPAGDSDQGLELTAQTRTPDQMAAFYIGRGFPAAMLVPIAHACFLSVGMRHTRDDVLWLEPSRWRLLDAKGNSVQRLDRDYWNKVWETLQAPPASRATFGWTQLPESRDLQPGEPLGGNITLVPPAGAFSLEMRFATGRDKKGPEVVARIEGLTCEAQSEDQAPEAGP
jgi:hypothetical protein